MSYTDPLLPFSGIHATTEDLKRNRRLARKLSRVKCQHGTCQRPAKMTFRLESAEIIDVCLTDYFYLANGLRDEDC